METRRREYEKLKKTLVEWNSFEEGMELRDMRNLIQTNKVQQNNKQLTKPSQTDKTIATKKGSPQWLRDEKNRLKHKDQTQPKNIVQESSAGKSSTTWQKKDYGRLVNKPSKLNTKQNGGSFNSTKKKNSYQNAAHPETTLTQVEEIPDDDLNTAFHNSPPPSPSDKPTKNGRILKSTLKKSSHQADDDSNVPASNSSAGGYSTFWSPLWLRSADKRLERKPFKTDFNLASFYKKRKNAKTLQKGDSNDSNANGHESEEIILTDDIINNNNIIDNKKRKNTKTIRNDDSNDSNANGHETEEINLADDITYNNNNNEDSPNLNPVNCSPPTPSSDKQSNNVQILNSTLLTSSQQANDDSQVPISNSNLDPVNCIPPSPPSDKNSNNVQIVNATQLTSSQQADDDSHVPISNSTTGYSTFWSPFWQRSDDNRLERKTSKTDFDLASFYKKRNNAKTLRNGDSNNSVDTENINLTDDTQAQANKASKKSPTNFNLEIINNNNENGNSNISDKDENVDHSQVSNSSADLTENSSSNISSKIEEREHSYANDNDENVDHTQFSNNSNDLTINPRSSFINLRRLKNRASSNTNDNFNLSLNRNNGNDEISGFSQTYPNIQNNSYYNLSGFSQFSNICNELINQVHEYDNIYVQNISETTSFMPYAVDHLDIQLDVSSSNDEDVYYLNTTEEEDVDDQFLNLSTLYEVDNEIEY